MEGTRVKELVMSREAGIAPSRPSRGTQTTPASHRPATTTTLSGTNSFSEAGARLSFKNVSENFSKTPNIGQLNPSPSTNFSPTPAPPHKMAVAVDLVSRSSQSAQKTQPISLPSTNTDVSGALKAASIAANGRMKPATPSGISKRPTKAEKIASLSQIAQLQTTLSRNGSTADAGLAAARASVPNPDSKESKAAHLPRTSGLSSQGNTRQSIPSHAIYDRVTAAASIAMIQSREASRIVNASSGKEPLNFEPSSIAARSVSSQAQSSPSDLSTDRERKFGVILSRSASPAVETFPLTMRHKPSTKRNQSLYQIPSATVSEPALIQSSLEHVDSASMKHKVSPLGRLSALPGLTDPSSSGGSSLADSGAATAMASRSSSATSLPTLSQAGDTGNPSLGPVRNRPIHLKVTMRKESRPEKENRKHSYNDSQSLSEAQRKRYEGIWASNHRLGCFPCFDDDAESKVLDGLIVRELWTRSNLSQELLAHIWRLVDQNNKGKLTREEFAVGMWLIDQCLSGRKLPANSVPIEVWSSAHRLSTFLRH